MAGEFRENLSQYKPTGFALAVSHFRIMGLETPFAHTRYLKENETLATALKARRKSSEPYHAFYNPRGPNTNALRDGRLNQ